MCSATSKVLLRSVSERIGQSNNHGTRIRWPELEIGANSVTPCVTPSTIACRMLRGTPFPDRGAGPRTGGPGPASGGRRRDGHGDLGERRRVGELLGDLGAHEK